MTFKQLQAKRKMEQMKGKLKGKTMKKTVGKASTISDRELMMENKKLKLQKSMLSKTSKSKTSDNSLMLENKKLKLKKKLMMENKKLKKQINKLTCEASSGDGVDAIYNLVDNIGISKESIIEAFFQYNSTDELGRFFDSLSGDYDVTVDSDDAEEILGEDTVFTELVNWMSTDEILEFVEYLNREFDIDDEEDEPLQYGVLLRDFHTAIPHLIVYAEESDARDAMGVWENISDMQMSDDANEYEAEIEDMVEYGLPVQEDDIEINIRSIDEGIYDYFGDSIKVLNEDAMFDVYI